MDDQTRNDTEIFARLSLLEFLSEQTFAKEVLASPEPVEGARSFRRELAAMMDRSYSYSTDSEGVSAVRNRTREVFAAFGEKVEERVLSALNLLDGPGKAE